MFVTYVSFTVCAQAITSCILYICTRVTQEYVDDVIRNHGFQGMSAASLRRCIPLSIFTDIYDRERVGAGADNVSQ